MARYASILETVGRTPVVRINRLAPLGVTLYLKVEAFNPLGSSKDRLALGVIDAAERNGELKPGQHAQGRGTRARQRAARHPHRRLRTRRRADVAVDMTEEECRSCAPRRAGVWRPRPRRLSGFELGPRRVSCRELKRMDLPR